MSKGIIFPYKIIWLLVIFGWHQEVCNGQSITVMDSIFQHNVYPYLSFAPDFQSVTSKRFISLPQKTTTLPFFCKMEQNIEKESKIAFRFRLGDLDYVNMLENKK